MTNYKDIYNFWNRNRCRSFNKDFPFSDYAGKRVLEIGYGDGLDGEAFVNAGADYTGIDLHDTPGAPYFKQMNAEEIEFPSYRFDLVYSWGVIHHAVNPEKVISEIHRVLKHTGQFYVMLYNKPSFRYNIEIMFLRRIAWSLRYYKYKVIRCSMPYPTKSEWISMNTDNLGCPLSRVYNKQEAHELFKDFVNVSSYTRRRGWFRIISGIK